MAHVQADEDPSPSQCNFLFTKIQNVILFQEPIFSNMYALFYVISMQALLQVH